MPPGTTFTNLYNWRRCSGNSRIGYFLTKLWFHPPMIQKLVPEKYMEWYLQKIQWYLIGKLSDDEMHVVSRRAQGCPH